MWEILTCLLLCSSCLSALSQPEVTTSLDEVLQSRNRTNYHEIPFVKASSKHVEFTGTASSRFEHSLEPTQPETVTGEPPLQTTDFPRTVGLSANKVAIRPGYCCGALTSSSGAIISPNYPQPYRPLLELSWLISVAQGSFISLVIQDFDLEEMRSCRADFLEVFDGATLNSPRIAKMCSQNHPSEINSKGNEMLLRFRSDMSIQGRGFRLKYSTVCNMNITGTHGVIESPGFPQGENIERECMWKIAAPAGNKVNITFSRFHVTDTTSEECANSFVKVYNGSHAPNNLLGKYCNALTPNISILSSLNNVYIHYKSSAPPLSNLIKTNVFRLEWKLSGIPS